MHFKIIDHFKQQQYQKVCDVFESLSGQEMAPHIMYFIAISYLFIDDADNALLQLKKIAANKRQLPDYSLYLAMALLKGRRI